jgi:hypothetical protein
MDDCAAYGFWYDPRLGEMGETALESVRRLQVTQDGQRSPFRGSPPSLAIGPASVINDPTVLTKHRDILDMVHRRRNLRSAPMMTRSSNEPAISSQAISGTIRDLTREYR